MKGKLLALRPRGSGFVRWIPAVPALELFCWLHDAKIAVCVLIWTSETIETDHRPSDVSRSLLLLAQ